MMTRAGFKARGAYQIARALRSLLRELFIQSTQQMELLESEHFEALEEALAKKEALLQMLPMVLEAANKAGWDLNNPATFPKDPACAPLVREAADFAAKLQAHEKYCLRQMMAQRNVIGEHLTLLMSKRNAAAGYRIPLNRGNTIDTER